MSVNNAEVSNSHQHNFSIYDITIEDILQIIRRRFALIVVILFAFLVGALMYHFSLTPKYRASALMMVTKSQAPTNLIDAVLQSEGVNDSKAAMQDIVLLTSLPVAEEVVQVLWESPERSSLEFFGYRKFEPLVEKLWRELGFIREFNAQDKSKKTTELILSDEARRLYALQLVSRIKVMPEKDTPILNISVASPFADESVFLTNTLCETYKTLDIARNSEKYLQSNGFVADMLEEQKQKLREADKSLSDFMKDEEIYEVSANMLPLLAEMVEADSRYNDVLAESRIVKNNRDFLEQKLSQSERDLSTRISRNVNARLGSILDEIRVLESEYIELLKKKGVHDSDAVAKKRQLDVVKTRYEQLSRSKIAGEIGYAGKEKRYQFDLISEKLQAERKLNQLEYTAGEYKRLKAYYERKLKLLPEKQQEYIRLERDREVVSKTYLFLKQQLDETRILLGSEVGGIAMIGSAFKPFRPISPNFTRNLLFGFALGISFALFMVLLVEYLDDTLSDDLFFRNNGYYVWSVVPFVSNFAKQSNRRGKQRLWRSWIPGGKDGNNELAIKYPLITDQLNSSFAESFRMLRTNLNFYRPDRKVKVIMVSGASIAEGKSTVCANLALANAISGQKTLLIDCDLRRPSLHKIFRAKRYPGLADLLLDTQGRHVESFIQKTSSSNLFVLTAGTRISNPNEMLSSKKMRTILHTLDGMFDKIVLDSPPLFLSDAAQLAHSVDTILLTARLKYSSKFPLIEYASDSFLREHIDGVVVIDTPNNSSYYKYGKRYIRGYERGYYQSYEE